MLDDYVRRLEGCLRNAPDGSEYWHARDLYPLLGYTRWENFEEVIAKGMAAAAGAGASAEDHFRSFTKMVSIGSGAERGQVDWFLSRYGCYLIAMNSDSRKAEVGAAQSYFAVQTRLQETQQQALTEEERRQMRELVRDANIGLASLAKGAGVRNFAIFNDRGYKGLYGGLGVSELKARKGIPGKDDLLDCVGHTELAANYFRITQAQQRIETRHIRDERQANVAHHEAGVEVRKSMLKISGVKPEDLPAAENLKRVGKGKEKQTALIEETAPADGRTDEES